MVLGEQATLCWWSRICVGKGWWWGGGGGGLLHAMETQPCVLLMPKHHKTMSQKQKKSLSCNIQRWVSLTQKGGHPRMNYYFLVRGPTLL